MSSNNANLAELVKEVIEVNLTLASAYDKVLDKIADLVKMNEALVKTNEAFGEEVIELRGLVQDLQKQIESGEKKLRKSPTGYSHEDGAICCSRQIHWEESCVAIALKLSTILRAARKRAVRTPMDLPEAYGIAGVMIRPLRRMVDTKSRKPSTIFALLPASRVFRSV